MWGAAFASMMKQSKVFTHDFGEFTFFQAQKNVTPATTHRVRKPHTAALLNAML